MVGAYLRKALMVSPSSFRCALARVGCEVSLARTGETAFAFLAFGSFARGSASSEVRFALGAILEI